MNNPPAFPTPPTFAGGEYDSGQSGMTLRDYFAAAAMQAFITAQKVPAHLLGVDELTAVSVGAYQQADAMLKAREQ